jgi:hypothetical protein
VSILFIVASHIVSWQQAATFVFSIFPAISRGSPYYYNQTIAGFWSRVYLPPETFDWLGLEVMPEVAAARLLALSFGLLLIVATVAFTYKFAGRYVGHPVGAALEFSMCLVIILVISPISWWHYFVWLTIPIGALFCQEVFTGLRPLRHQYTRLLIPIAVLLINIPPNSLIPWSLSFAKSSLLLADLWISMGLLGALTLLVTLVFIYRAYPARGN